MLKGDPNRSGKPTMLFGSAKNVNILSKYRRAIVEWLNFGTILTVLGYGLGAIILVALIAGSLMSKKNWRPGR